MRYAKAMILGSLVWMGAPALWAVTPNGQYTDLANGTVRDNKTGLVWQQGIPNTKMTWDSAKAYCSQLSLGGLSGWRLPEKLELESIVNVTVPTPGSAVDETAFPSTPADMFWTATPVAGYSDVAWSVNFLIGTTNISDTPYSYWVRCVR